MTDNPESNTPNEGAPQGETPNDSSPQQPMYIQPNSGNQEAPPPPPPPPPSSGAGMSQEPMYNQPPMLPNATATMVLGILSIVTCFCYGIIGIILGIIGLGISGKHWRMYKENPQAYRGGENMKAGRIMSIIGICLSSLYILFIIVYVMILGYSLSMAEMYRYY